MLSERTWPLALKTSRGRNCKSKYLARRSRGADWRCARDVGHNAAMLVIALDTTTRPGSEALVLDGAVIGVQAGDPTRPHAERLPGDLLALLAANGRSLADVDVFAVASGPGSFTGLRIGIAAMQGLAFAGGRPVVGVSALDALAATAHAFENPRTRFVAPWMNAQRGEVFASLFRCAPSVEGRSVLELVDDPLVDGPREVVARWRKRGVTGALFIGDGALQYREWLADAPELVDAVLDPVPALAPAIAMLALARIRAGEVSLPHALVPLYVRRPDAEIARDRRAIGS